MPPEHHTLVASMNWWCSLRGNMERGGEWRPESHNFKVVWPQLCNAGNCLWQVLVAISKTGSGYEKGYKKRTDFNLEQWNATWMGNKNRTHINLEKWNATQGGTKRELLQFNSTFNVKEKIPIQRDPLCVWPTDPETLLAKNRGIRQKGLHSERNSESICWRITDWYLYVGRYYLDLVVAR